jgi:UDP-N-acetylglucosamine transferase subunit ALG13
MPPKMAFVTVGTTSFDSLIETVSTDEFIEVG